MHRSFTLSEKDIDGLPSRPFQGWDWSVHANVLRLIDSLFAEYKAWYKSDGTDKRIRDPDKIKQHLTHFALEAYRTHRALPDLCMGVHLGNAYYNKDEGRYHPNHLSYRIVKNVTDFLVAADYLEMPSGLGTWHPDRKQRRTTRFRATQWLMDLCDEHRINPYMIVPYENPECIILRAKKKRGQSSGDQIAYPDTSFTVSARKNLQKINKYIAGHHINLDITDDREETLLHLLGQRNDPARDGFLDFTKTRLKRIFNNGSFEQGGRFYGGWWQQIPGDYRVLITINGKRTVQLDYSGMHFAVMYAEMGLDTPVEDPYALDGYDVSLRGNIKTAFNIIINCASRKQAIGTIDGRIKDGKLLAELVSGEKLLRAFSDTHPLIKDKIASGEGVRGQFVDSQVAESILLKGIGIGLCILPIHDGFIAMKGDEIVLDTLMNEAFYEVTGHKPKIKPETFDISVLDNEGAPHWITRSDGTIERNGIMEGKATSFSIIPSVADLWGAIEGASEKKKRKELRDREWESVHGHR